MAKYALLIGINYVGQEGELRGCVNDALAMREFLTTKCGYKPENIDTLIDDKSQMAFSAMPTYRNIMRYLFRLIKRAHRGKAKEVFIHYSGHGTYEKDTDGDEDDGKDEALVPLDYDKYGMIVDDDLRAFLGAIPEGCRVMGIMDCCHSGTILDLPFRYVGDLDHVKESKSDLDGEIYMISGCMDTQTSADAYIDSDYAGAMTSAFLNSVESLDYEVSFKSLLEHMREYLDGEYTQVPQLSSSVKIMDSSNFCTRRLPAIVMP